MNQESGALEARSLRMPLAGLRVVGLILALVLTNLNRESLSLPAAILDKAPAFSALLCVIELLLGIVASRVNGVLMIFIILVDLLFGLALCYFCGTAYLILGFMLPVVESTAFCGFWAGVAIYAIAGIFFGAALGVPLLQQRRVVEGPEGAVQAAQALMSLKMAGVLGALTGFLLWLTQSVMNEAMLVHLVEAEADQERRLLQETINKKDDERQTSVVAVSQYIEETTRLEEAGDKFQSEIHKLESKVQELETIICTLDQTLEESKVNEEKLKLSLRQTNERSSQSLNKQKNELERDHFIIQKKYDKLLKLLTICRDLNLNLGLNETLMAMTTQIQSVVPSQSLVVFLVDEVDGHRELFPELAASPYVDAFKDRVFQFDEEGPGWCAANRRPLRIDDGKLTVADRVITTLTPQEKSALICPLIAGQVVVGVLYLGRQESEEFSPEEGEFLLRIAEFSAQCLANSLEYQRRINHGLSDYATGLYNGLFLDERTKEEVMRGRRYTYPVSLILFSLDGFSEALPRMDKALAHKVANEVADIVRQAVRETDVPTRLEDNLFGVLLVHTERDKARAIGERIRAGVESRVFSSAQQKFKFTVSGGIAGVPHDGTSAEMLKKRAGDGMNLAKSKSGNKVMFWDE